MTSAALRRCLPRSGSANVFSLSSQNGGEGRGEEAGDFRTQVPSPHPSPRSVGERASSAPSRCSGLRPAQALLWALLLLFACATGLVLYRFDPVVFHFYPVCVFHQTTGLWCPGCGTLRALHQLLHGHLVAAFRFNALFVLSIPLLCGYGLRLALAKAAGQPAPSVRPAWLWLALAAIVVFGILRNLPFPAFAWMAPAS
jgi:hypothetical protein